MEWHAPLSYWVAVQEWVRQNEALFWWLTIGSAVMFVGSLAALPWLVARIPVDYFSLEDSHGPFFDAHPAVRIVLLILKNLVGLVLIVAGIAMLVLPGQGLLSLLIGLSLMNFPGKRRAELWLIARPGMMRLLNWIRRKWNRPPLEPPRLPGRETCAGTVSAVSDDCVLDDSAAH